MLEIRKYSYAEMIALLRKALGLPMDTVIEIEYQIIPPANYQEISHDEITGFRVEMPCRETSCGNTFRQV